jgi:NAD(P)H-hydrate epimerase
MKIVTPSQMKEIDRRAIEDFQVPSLDLMERAGSAVAERVKKLLSSSGPEPLVTILAGKGNNGGDALVAARLLREEGISAETFLLAHSADLTGDGAANLARLRAAGGPVREVLSDRDLAALRQSFSRTVVAVDGIFGTGFSGAASGLIASAIELLNSFDGWTVAIDIPSGLDGESGAVTGPAVAADWTVTMGAPKTGLIRRNGPDLCGRIEVAEIGLPPALLENLSVDLEMIDRAELSGIMPPRRRSSHKGDFGHLLVLAGSPGFTGAAALCASAALRAGAGLVTVAVPQSLAPIMAGKYTEAMTLALPETPEGTLSVKAREPILEFLKKADAWALGPGLSRNDATGELVRQVITACSLPLVIDADGLNLIARDSKVLRRLRGTAILTPHPGEMGRLIGKGTKDVLDDREGVARDFARSFKLTLVLKGAGTLIASPRGPLLVNPTGNPGMATGGTGDVLTGLIGGFLAQKVSPLDAARLAVFVHGAAGDRAAEKVGQLSLIASDLLAEVPAVLKEIFPWD